MNKIKLILKRKIMLTFLNLIIVFTLVRCNSDDGIKKDENPAFSPVQVTKTNSTKLYMHYMPWFHSKDFSGYWGYHWRMSNKNPDNIIDGKREIAAHYYPLIGPYDSSDPDVIEYHLLLMKYSGIDGVLIDWYGTHRVFDYYSNLQNSNALIEKIDTTGLEFAIVYEEFTTENVADRSLLTDIEAAREDMIYMEENYFSRDDYILFDGVSLLLTFGPRYFKLKSQWTEIFEVLDSKPHFFPLWNFSHRVGDSNAYGEFSWVDFDYETNSGLEQFYQQKNTSRTIGSLYPGFHDYYFEGGVGESYGYIPHRDGETLRSTITSAENAGMKYLQLITWNDFGEGTIFEPTLEFGFSYLEIIQEFAGVVYGLEELELIHEYYLKKKANKGNREAEQLLKQAYLHFNTLEVDEAREILNQL